MSGARKVLAAAAIAVIVFLAVLVVPTGGLRCRAVVDAAETFSIESAAPGIYRWTLRDGSAAGGQLLVRQRALQFERSGLVELRLASGLNGGDPISQGQPVATVLSQRTATRLAELQSQRASLAAQRDLLVAGGAPEVVEEARRRVDVAEAVVAAGQAELDRLRLLAATGLASDGELEVAELDGEIDRLEVTHAQALVDVAREPVRPQALAEIEARLAAVEAGITEARHLMGEEQILSPISGIAGMGNGDAELRVDRLDTVFLDLPIPVEAAPVVLESAEILFTTAAVPGTVFRGTLVELAGAATSVQGRPSVWASARIDNPGLRLRPGMVGTALVPVGGTRVGRLASARHRLLALAP